MSRFIVKNVGSVINGEEFIGDGRFRQEVRNPYTSELVGTIDYATAEDLDHAIETAHHVFHETMKKTPAYERSDILRRTSDLLEREKEVFAQTVTREAGKPIRDSRAEVGRAVQVLRFAADEAKKIEGEVIPMDAAIGGENRIGFIHKYPIGVVGAITPFNFPLNLVLHKLAPAIAAGNTVVLKPAEKTPLTSVMLLRLFEEAGLPKGALNVVMGTGSEIGEPLVTNNKISKITFTGSAKVGLHIKKIAELKKVTLELGSNSPNIIFEDANLTIAAASLVKGAFAFAGQVCISVQRIYVQRTVYQEFLDKFVPLVKSLKIGNPLDEDTDIGGLITEDSAVRAKEWVQEAISQGATLLTGGKLTKSVLEPTVLVDVTPKMKVVCQEVFAPIVSVIPFDDENEVLALANDSDYGLQAGVFTNDINRALRFARELETGGVWINEISTYRQDNYPYGGVKMSGIGKEGVKYAIEDMLESKFIGIKLL
jgi:acyl-CoA reductase-like NAD-dependent aldehyde dehydrogenase